VKVSLCLFARVSSDSAKEHRGTALALVQVSWASTLVTYRLFFTHDRLKSDVSTPKLTLTRVVSALIPCAPPACCCHASCACMRAHSRRAAVKEAEAAAAAGGGDGTSEA
jgi:hypothetical protein